MDKFTKFLPIVKVEEQSDGTLHVYGVVTAEQPDRDREVCDYAKTVPYYKKTVDEMLKITSVEGMESSIMPLREMHQLKAVGKGISIDFDDAAKTVRMGFEVVDAEAIKKVKKGVLPAFSQGGNYVGDKVPDPVFKGCMRYTADPGEVSLVDRGCLPVAVIDAIKGQSFPLVKADGSIELVKMDLDAPKRNFTEADALMIADLLAKRLAKEEKTKRVGGKDLHSSDFAHVGDADDPSTWKLPIHDAAHARNALARFNQTEGIPADEKAKVKAKIKAAAKKHGVNVGDEAEKIKKAIGYLDSAVNGKPLEKGLYDVAQMAQILETLSWMQSSAVYEREMEGDASTQPEDFGQLLQDAILLFHSMVEEETSELAERAAAISGRGDKAMKISEMTAGDLEKAAKSAMGHLKDLHAMHKAFHGKMTKAHASHMADAQECVGKCVKAMGGDTSEFDASGDGPNSDDPTASDDGTSGHAHETGGAAPAAKGRYVSIGKNDKGVEMFKFVAVNPLDEIRDLLKGLPELIDKKVDEGLTVAIKAMFSTEGADGEIAKAAPGVGDRNLVVSRAPVQTTGVISKDAVTKTSDMGNGGDGGNKAVTLTDAEWREVVIKAGNGDVEAKLKLAKLNKLMTQEEAASVQAHMGGIRK